MLIIDGISKLGKKAYLRLSPPPPLASNKKDPVWILKALVAMAMQASTPTMQSKKTGDFHHSHEKAAVSGESCKGREKSQDLLLVKPQRKIIATFCCQNGHFPTQKDVETAL